MKGRGDAKEENQVLWDRDRNAVRSLWFGHFPTESTAKGSHCAEELRSGPKLLKAVHETITQAREVGTQILHCWFAVRTFFLGMARKFFQKHACPVLVLCLLLEADI